MRRPRKTLEEALLLLLLSTTTADVRRLPPDDEKFALARRLQRWARAPGPPHRACLLHHHQVLPRRPCGIVVVRAALPIARALCHDFLAATVTATLATTALATDTALSVTIVLAQDVQLHVLVDRPRCSACEGRGVRGLQDARGILGEVRTHGMVWDTAHNYSYHTPSLSICISTPLQ